MKKRGFTLIEIICTVTLLITAYAIFLHNYNFTTLGASYESDAIISDINYIKSLSYQGDDKAKIIFDVAKNAYIIKSATDDEEIRLKNIRLISCSNYELTFSKSGWTKGTTLMIYSNGKYSKLSVSAITGRIKLKDEENYEQ